MLDNELEEIITYHGANPISDDVKRVKQVFTKHYWLTPKYPNIFPDPLIMTGQEWYDRFEDDFLATKNSTMSDVDREQVLDSARKVAGIEVMKIIPGSIMLPIMNWDKPIEQEILQYVRSMKMDMQRVSDTTMWRRTRREAEIYVSAYETVQKHIEREIEIRKFTEDRHDKLNTP